MQKAAIKSPFSLGSLITIISIVSYINSAALKTFSASCLCDITDICDNQCCCDAECPTQLTSILTKYNRCENDNFGIPLCQKLNLTDVHYDDLYSGLKTIYTVVKRLFCVSRINIVDPTFYYTKNWVASDAIKTDAIARIQSKISASTLKPSNIASLSEVQINYVIYRSDLGICTKFTSIPAGIGTNGVQECRAFVNPTNIGLNQFLAIQKLIAIYPTIKVYSMVQSTDQAPNHLPALTSTCSGGTCFSIVKYIKLFINPNSNAINQDLSYIVVGDLSISNNAYIMLRYDYEYLNADGTFANSSNIGYNIGTPLQLIKRYTDSLGNIAYRKIFNPINLAYRTPNGDCRTSATDSVDQSMIELKLGKNQFHTCITTSNTDILLYENLKNSFNMIGIMGSSNSVLGDYVSVTWPSNKLTNILLKIYYTKVGLSENPQYYILKADVLQANQLNQRTLFIQYQEVVNNASMYIPPPPTVDAYLPNDFLYPFYVAA